jgi:hypothetical protein
LFTVIFQICSRCVTACRNTSAAIQ